MTFASDLLQGRSPRLVRGEPDPLVERTSRTADRAEAAGEALDAGAVRAGVDSYGANASMASREGYAFRDRTTTVTPITAASA
jgi:hypothetical protein